jgi:hypothetical protein
MQTPMMARFLLRASGGHYLKDAPGGSAFLTEDAATLRQGKTVFAERCARCHSSKLPDLPAGFDLASCNGKDYLGCWNRDWEWAKTEDFKRPMRDLVLADDFLNDNYLSSELRVPSTLLQTNVCSPIATNAIAGDIWDNFSSASYKELPSVGSVTVRHPMTGAASDYPLPGGGRGFTRPASLVSAWSTAPFLQNNTIGRFDVSPSVEARMRVFTDAIEQMLWPERRPKDPIFANDNGPGVGTIDRTTAESVLSVPSGYIPSELRGLLGLGQRLFPMFFRNGAVEIGPIPRGFPISLLANVDMLGPNELTAKERADRAKMMVALLTRIKNDLRGGRDAFADPQTVDMLLSLNKCKDFVVNKGHYFGTSFFTEEPALSDADKRALIGFIKTM